MSIAPDTNACPGQAWAKPVENASRIRNPEAEFTPTLISVSRDSLERLASSPCFSLRA